MAIGMYFHHFPRPHPPKPAFTVRIPSRLSKQGGYFKLVFYVPDEYYNYEGDASELRFPVVINYHGGGFTLGTGTDDGRWARTVIETTNSVFVSVEYRLAPKYAFSVGVEDCSDAVIYLAAHAEELRLDPQRVALSGFSAGANYALTVPLVLHDLQTDAGKRSLQQDRPNRPSNLRSVSNVYKQNAAAASTSASLSDDPKAKSTSSLNLPLKGLLPTELEIDQRLPSFTIKTIISFYPPTDFRITRDEKKATNPRPEFNLPPMLTNLFDDSYLSPKNATHEFDFSDPYLSPAAASDYQLAEAYPQSIILYTCEYDMLCAEGVAFAERLKSPPLSKTVKGGLIHAVPHAFDKKPNPIRFPKDASRCYSEACAELNVVFGNRESVEARRQLDQEVEVERFEDVSEVVVKEPDESKEEYRKRQSISEHGERKRSLSIGPSEPLVPGGQNAGGDHMVGISEVETPRATA